MPLTCCRFASRRKRADWVVRWWLSPWFLLSIVYALSKSGKASPCRPWIWDTFHEIGKERAVSLETNMDFLVAARPSPSRVWHSTWIRFCTAGSDTLDGYYIGFTARQSGAKCNNMWSSPVFEVLTLGWIAPWPRWSALGPWSFLECPWLGRRWSMLQLIINT